MIWMPLWHSAVACFTRIKKPSPAPPISTGGQNHANRSNHPEMVSLTGPAATSAGPYFWIGFRPAGPAIAITLQALGSAEGYFHRRRSTLHSTAGWLLAF